MRSIRRLRVGLLAALVLAMGGCVSPPEPGVHGDCFNAAGELVACGASDEANP